jgi:sensor histidine kinase YesM
MQSKLRKWLVPFAWPNIAVALVMLILLITKQGLSAREFVRVLGYSLLYANLVAVFAMFLIGVMVKKFAWRRFPLVPVLVFCVLVIVPVGCLGVQSLLASLGLIRWQYFWPQYFAMMRACLPLAAIFSLGAFVHSSLRLRLVSAEERLREKELAEERARKLAAEARLQSLEARLRPHFLFNTLNSISALIATDPERAEQIVERLATQLRTSLDTSDRPLISMREELVIVQSYFDIEKARFGDRLSLALDVPTGLQDAKVPPMSVQSLVENAVKHGIGPQASGGQIRVAASSENGDLHVAVSDSGPGFDLTVVPAGHGLENLVERLDVLFGDKAKLKTDCRDGHCVVEMVLPRA